MRKLNLSFSVLTAIIVMLFASCGDGTTENNSEGDDSNSNTEETVDVSVVGSWTVTKGEGFAADGEVGSKYVYTEDGNLSMGEGANTLTTTYEMKDGNIVSASSVPDVFYVWETELTETELIIYSEDKDQKLWLTRD